MRIVSTYSHLNGDEYMIVHHNHLRKEIHDLIASVDAEQCKTKISKERNRKGAILYAPKEMNRVIANQFDRRGWEQHRQTFGNYIE